MITLPTVEKIVALMMQGVVLVAFDDQNRLVILCQNKIILDGEDFTDICSTKHDWADTFVAWVGVKQARLAVEMVS